MKKYNFLKEDKKRSILAQKEKINQLRKTYKGAKLANPNTQIFWDEKIKDSIVERHRDEMTKDRIKVAVSFVKKQCNLLLDVGLGYGYFEKLINDNRSNIRLSGIDLSEESIKFIRKDFKGTFKKGSILKIPFHKNSFDTVVALEILEHLQAVEVFKAYKEIKRVLKPSGQFILSVPVYEKYTINFNPNRHMRSYIPILIKEEIRLAGFKIQKIKTLCAFSKWYRLKKLIRTIVPNRWKPNVIIISCIKK